MIDNETVVAERRVQLTVDRLDVRISTHAAEGFWRVHVADSRATRQVSTTTVGGDDTFLWPLIRAAVNGDEPAWQHLAHWGHHVMHGRSTGLRTAG